MIGGGLETKAEVGGATSPRLRELEEARRIFVIVASVRGLDADLRHFAPRVCGRPEPALSLNPQTFNDGFSDT